MVYHFTYMFFLIFQLIFCSISANGEEVVYCLVTGEPTNISHCDKIYKSWNELVKDIATQKTIEKVSIDLYATEEISNTLRFPDNIKNVEISDGKISESQYFGSKISGKLEIESKALLLFQGDFCDNLDIIIHCSVEFYMTLPFSQKMFAEFEETDYKGLKTLEFVIEDFDDLKNLRIYGSRIELLNYVKVTADGYIAKQGSVTIIEEIYIQTYDFEKDPKRKLGLIIGLSLGSVAVVTIIVFVIYFRLKKKKNVSPLGVLSMSLVGEE